MLRSDEANQLRQTTEIENRSFYRSASFHVINVMKSRHCISSITSLKVFLQAYLVFGTIYSKVFRGQAYRMRSHFKTEEAIPGVAE